MKKRAFVLACSFGLEKKQNDMDKKEQRDIKVKGFGLGSFWPKEKKRWALVIIRPRRKGKEAEEKKEEKKRETLLLFFFTLVSFLFVLIIFGYSFK